MSALESTLLEVAEATVVAFGTIRVTSVRVDLPAELSFSGNEADGLVVVQPPRWRWHTDFDRTPGRLQFTIHAERQEEASHVDAEEADRS